VNVTRAFVQLQHPDKVEGDDYRIPHRRASVSGGASLGPFATTSACR
jgi:hypothetical protein